MNSPIIAVTVAELIQHLQTLPQDVPVAYQCYSEYCLLGLEQVRVQELPVARPDGWVHDYRCDKPSTTYVTFPGN